MGAFSLIVVINLLNRLEMVRRLTSLIRRANLEIYSCRFCATRAKQYEKGYKHLTNKRTSEYVSEKQESKYRSSKDYKHVSDFPMPLPEYEKMEYEIVRDKFQYVEDYLPLTFNPIPSKEFTASNESPSGWVPVDESKFRINPSTGKSEHESKPYIVRRALDHNVPVYEFVEMGRFKTGRVDPYNEYNVTKITFISGNIWELRADLTNLIKEKHDKELVYSQVDEIAGSITFEGFYRYCIRDYLVSLGF